MRVEDPASSKAAFRDLKCWVEDTLDIFRAELLRALYPLFVHVYLDLVSYRQQEAAKDFFTAFQSDFETLFPSKKAEIGVLSSVTDILHLHDNTIASTYRSHKYKLSLGQYAFDLFRTYLEEHGLSHFMKVISHYFDIKIGRFDCDGIIGVDALSDASVDVRASIVCREAEDVILNTDAYKYDQVEQFAAQLKRQRCETQLRSNSPTLICAEVEKLRDLCARVSVSAHALPSACCYTIFGGNATCAELSEDCRLLAVGFDDSTIEIVCLDGTLRRLKTSADLGKAEDPARKEKRVTRRAAKEQSDQRILSYLNDYGDNPYKSSAASKSGQDTDHDRDILFEQKHQSLQSGHENSQKTASQAQKFGDYENEHFDSSQDFAKQEMNQNTQIGMIGSSKRALSSKTGQHNSGDTRSLAENLSTDRKLHSREPQQRNDDFGDNSVAAVGLNHERRSSFQKHQDNLPNSLGYDTDPPQAATPSKRKRFDISDLESNTENNAAKTKMTSSDKISAAESAYFASKARASDDGFTDAFDEQKRTDIDYNLEHIFGKQTDKKEQKKDCTAHLYTDIGQSTRLIGHSGPVYAIKFFKGNKYLLTCSQDCTVRLWSLELFTCLAIYKSHVFPIWTIDVSPNNLHFASGGADKHALIWSIMGSRPERLFISALSDVTVVKFHPNGNYILIGSNDCKIRMHSINDAALLRIYNGHTDGISCIEISPCGKLMLSGSRDKTVILWDLSTSKVLSKYQGHEGTIYSVAFCWFGNLIASVGADNTMRIWDRSENKEKPCAVFLTKSTPLFHVRFEYRNIISTVGPYQP